MKQMRNPDLVETGQKLKELRKQAGLTQEQLAEKVGGTCTNTVISRYERGIVEMGIQTMYDLAEALKVSSESLIPDRLLHKTVTDSDGSSNPQNENIAPKKQKQPLDFDIAELILQLDENNREKAKDYIETLLFKQQHTT